MSLEQKARPLERLELESLVTGNVVCITTGTGLEAWTYVFHVVKSGKQPEGTFVAFNPGGELVGPMEVVLRGSGRWTTPDENPCQLRDPYQAKAVTPCWGSLITGDHLIISASINNGTTEQLIFDKPGQEISEIQFLL